MNVGQVSRHSGLPVKTIRYYDEIGLVRPDRAENGYRDYSASDVQQLTLLKRARDLGFSLEECRQLLDLYQNETRASHDVQQLAISHVDTINTKIRQLKDMKQILQNLISSCQGDESPGCAILEDLVREKVNT